MGNPINLYAYYAIVSGHTSNRNGVGGRMYREVDRRELRHYLQKGSRSLEYFNPWKGRKILQKYLVDCPELKKKAQSLKWLLKHEMHEIVSMYNKDCGSE